MSGRGTFEENLQKLEDVVRRLEEGQLPLEEALELFAEGLALAKMCHRKLEEAEQKISILTADWDGNLILKKYE